MDKIKLSQAAFRELWPYVKLEGPVSENTSSIPVSKGTRRLLLVVLSEPPSCALYSVTQMLTHNIQDESSFRKSKKQKTLLAREIAISNLCLWVLICSSTTTAVSARAHLRQLPCLLCLKPKIFSCSETASVQTLLLDFPFDVCHRHSSRHLVTSVPQPAC